jgi:hypothetical protein
LGLCLSLVVFVNKKLKNYKNKKMTFTNADLKQFEDKGIAQSQIEEQISNFENGFPLFQLEKAATIGDGLHRIETNEINKIIDKYDLEAKNLKVCKFVPASGAASRMFKDLFAFMESYDGSAAAKAAYKSNTGFYSMYNFIHKITDFAFYEDLKGAIANDNLDLNQLIESEDYGTIIDYLLTEKGLNYGNLPKGLLKFHRYGSVSRTPIEEHLVEAANYAKAADGSALLHFTVSPEHRSRFIEKIEEVRVTYERTYATKFKISLSEQEGYTDTIAVDTDFSPFRLSDNSILFRPGGHGALIENLNRLEADIVFIKNIDNVVPDNLKADTFTYKKLIGGVLLNYRNRIFDYYQQLSANISAALVNEIVDFYQNELSTILPATFANQSTDEKAAVLLQKLNRPARVCGMVKNEGEPGGGPFWSINADGSVSLQIVESSQVDKNNGEQAAIMNNSSHFNPVDLVCSLTNHEGEKFNLLDFRDPKTGFITEKSKDGRDLLAQELPGLWNGAMADWNTIFVEVSLATFNPVKVVGDLLRTEHQ